MSARRGHGDWLRGQQALRDRAYGPVHNKLNRLFCLSYALANSDKGDSQEAQHRKFVPQFRWQGIHTSPLVARAPGRAGLRPVADSASPERLGRPAGQRHQLRVQHHPGAGGAVVAAVLDDVHDTLAHGMLPPMTQGIQSPSTTSWCRRGKLRGDVERRGAVVHVRPGVRAGARYRARRRRSLVRCSIFPATGFVLRPIQLCQRGIGLTLPGDGKSGYRLHGGQSPRRHPDRLAPPSARASGTDPAREGNRRLRLREAARTRRAVRRRRRRPRRRRDDRARRSPTAASGCVPTWTRCRSPRRTGLPTPRPTRA